MNKGMLTVGIIMLSLIALLLINILNNYSTGSELDYYLLKETTSAAMEDAIDYTYYRENGLIRIDKEKFVENFLRRFADNVDNTRTYDVKFYDLNEVPPKVSVKVESETVLSAKGQSAAISTQIDAIIEANAVGVPFVETQLKDENSDVGKAMTEKEEFKVIGGE